MNNLRCPHCRKLIWPWQHALRLTWNYVYIRNLHTSCALAFRRSVL